MRIVGILVIQLFEIHHIFERLESSLFVQEDDSLGFKSLVLQIRASHPDYKHHKGR